MKVLSAASFEVQFIKEHFGDRFEYFNIGVGVHEAVKNSFQLKSKLVDQDVLFVGSCGTFSDHFSQIELVGVDRVIWSPTCERQGLSYQAIKPLEPIQLDSSPIQDIRKVTTLCSPNISLKADLPESLRLQREQLVENLELYSAARELVPVCRSFQAVLAVVNSVGPDAHVEWKQNFKSAAKLTADKLARHFDIA